MLNHGWTVANKKDHGGVHVIIIFFYHLKKKNFLCSKNANMTSFWAVISHISMIPSLLEIEMLFFLSILKTEHGHRFGSDSQEVSCFCKERACVYLRRSQHIAQSCSESAAAGCSQRVPLLQLSYQDQGFGSTNLHTRCQCCSQAFTNAQTKHLEPKTKWDKRKDRENNRAGSSSDLFVFVFFTARPDDIIDDL